MKNNIKILLKDSDTWMLLGAHSITALGILGILLAYNIL
jgi:hypothetical protein